MARTKNKKKLSRRRRVPLPLGGFPDRKLARLKYVEFITLDPTASASAVPTINHFRANSLFDPNQTGTGHQPRGYDEHCAIYDHYTVIGSKIKATFESDVDNVANVGQYCFLLLQDTNSTPPDLISILEDGMGKADVKFRPYDNTTGKSCVLTAKYSPYKMFGLPKNVGITGVDSLTPTIGSNPAEDAIYTVGVMCQRTTSTNPAKLVVRVEIEYIAIFTEKRPINQS